MNKRFITHISNSGIQELIMLDNVSHGESCRIHNTVKSATTFPVSERQFPKFCGGLTQSHQCFQKNINTVRKKSRGRSPKRSSHGIKKVSISPCHKCCTIHETLSSGENKKNENYKLISNTQGCLCPALLSSSFVSIEKSYGTPERTCSHVSKVSTQSVPTAIKRNSVKSQNTLQVCHSVPTNSQMMHHVTCTVERVAELKNEIDKVQSQLSHFALNKNKKQFSDEQGGQFKQFYQLKVENKYLKKKLGQKRKLQEVTVKEVQKAKDILNDYEKKVKILHEQAIKSSKMMKQSKDKFCKCLQQKEDAIKELQMNNDNLVRSVQEHEAKYTELNKFYENLQEIFNENKQKYGILSENNQNFCECIQFLESQLQNSVAESERYKEEIKKAEQKMANIKCTVCQKLEVKIKRQKDKYENRLIEFEENEKLLKNEISVLSDRQKELESKLSLFDEVQNKCTEFEAVKSKCKNLEEKCKQYCETICQNEDRFDKERREMRQLVDELTTVVKENKVTLLQLSNINKQQESLLESQSAVLSQKDEQIREAESNIEMMKKKSVELEREVENLKISLSKPCNREICVSLSRQLEDLEAALNLERDNQLVKDKIIEDQTQTVCCLQLQIKEKLSELTKAKDVAAFAKNETIRINNDLLRTHRELEKELNDKKLLMQKMMQLEYQKSQLVSELDELEKLVEHHSESQKYEERQQHTVVLLQKQIEKQKTEWQTEKEMLASEKEKALYAAKFATQKLFDTVADFQKQVDTQKKVQNMLTSMLHDKEEELKLAKIKITSINSFTRDMENDIPMNEIYKRTNGIDLSNPATTTSFYSSCSNCSRNALKFSQNYDVQQLFNLLTRTEEEPIKDS